MLEMEFCFLLLKKNLVTGTGRWFSVVQIRQKAWEGRVWTGLRRSTSCGWCRSVRGTCRLVVLRPCLTLDYLGFITIHNVVCGIIAGSFEV